MKEKKNVEAKSSIEAF